MLRFIATKTRLFIVMVGCALVLPACVLFSNAYGVDSPNGIFGDTKFSVHASISEQIDKAYWGSCNQNYYGCWLPNMFNAISDPIARNWMEDPSTVGALVGDLWAAQKDCFNWGVQVYLPNPWDESQDTYDWGSSTIVPHGSWACS